MKNSFISFRAALAIICLLTTVMSSFGQTTKGIRVINEDSNEEVLVPFEVNKSYVPFESTVIDNVLLEPEQGDALYPVRHGYNEMKFYYGNIIAISTLDDSYYLTKIIFETKGIYHADATCNGESFAGTYIASNTSTTKAIIINGSSNNKIISMIITGIKIYYKKHDKIKAPAPTLLNYDDSEKTVTLCVKDNNGNELGNVDILYAITNSESQPTDGFLCYDGIINLNDVYYENNHYYLWAQARKEGMLDSDIVLINHFYIETPEGSNVVYERLNYGNELHENFWYIITASIDGKLYALGRENSSGGHDLVKIGIDNMTTSATEKKFNELGVLEFTVKDGHLIEKNSLKYLMPSVSSRSLNDNKPASTKFVIDKNNQHSLIINGESLGYDETGFKFGSAGQISLFTTGSNINTSIDEIIKSDNDTDAEYYNLQGIKVTSPKQGCIYIKKVGTKTTKIILK